MLWGLWNILVLLVVGLVRVEDSVTECSVCADGVSIGGRCSGWRLWGVFCRIMGYETISL